MRFPAPMIDYRKVSFNNLLSPTYSHILLLLFWPVFGCLFYIAEHHHPAANYISVYVPLDDYIPFMEIFVIPYLFWFLFLIGIHVYTFFYDVASFKKLMYFIILTYGTSIILFYLFPTCQELRPESFPRDNIFTRFMAEFYSFDTNTNVCPSLHVVGSLAVMFTARHCSAFQSFQWRIFFTVITFLITVSTVFLKQHSVVDIAVAIPICLISYWLCFLRPKTRCQEM